MSAEKAWPGRHRIAYSGVPDVLTVGHAPGLMVDRLEHVLEDGLPDIEKLPCSSVELPEQPILAEREQQALVVEVNQHRCVQRVDAT